MTLRIFQDPNWKLVKTLRVFRDSIVDWAEPKKVSVWRDPDGDDVGFWNLVYPDLPMVLATPSVSGTGRLGTSYSLSDSTPWVEDGYVKVQTTTYQWARSLTSGGPYTDISGATSATYTVQQQDTESGGYYFICKITGTNAKGSTIVNSTQSLRAYDPDYTFQFGRSLGVNARSAIMFDEQSGGGFPNSLFVAGRVLGMFIGSWKFFDLYYKSDLSTLRIYYRFYRASQTTRPASPSGEIEVVFTSGSQFAEVYVPNPVSPVYVESYSAYILDLFTTLQSYEPLLVRNVGGRSFSNGVVTISTTTSHSFPVGASVYVTNADDRFNGVYPIIGTTSTTIRYNVSITSSITNKSLTSNVATLTTSAAHSFNVGDSVSITGVDSVFNGNYTITAVPSTTTFRYSRVNSNIASTSSGGTATLTNVPFALISSSANARAARSISDASYKFTVPLSDTGSVSMSVQSGSTSPSFLSGWIYIGLFNDSENITITFSPGSSQSSPILGTINGSFNKQNMYWPTSATIAEPNYVSNSFAYVSWSGSNANSYSITVKRADNSTIVYGPEITTLPEQTINGLSLGTTYNIEVSPNSRSDRLGQFGLTSTKSYLHATVPSAPTNVSGTKGNAQVALTWTAPASTNGSAITGYKVRYSTNGGVSWLPATPLSTGSTSNSYTVTGLTNGTSYIFQVLATNAKGDSLWSTSSASIIPEIVPTKIAVTASPTSILTIGGTSTFTAQLQDASNNNVAKSGVSITFSMTAALGGSINNTTVTTDATGKATTTYTSSTTSGTATVKATSTGLTEGSASITVSARTGLTPSLTAAGTGKGVSFSNTNHNTSYTYALASGPTSGTLESGDSYNNTQFDILTSRARDARPSVTVDSANKQATTSNTTFVSNSSVSLSIRSSRDGYTSVTSNVATATANITVSSRTYSWQFSTDGGSSWRTDWPAAFSGTASQTLSWTGTPNSRRIRCQVTSNLSNGATDTATTTNEPIIP
jgi:hypothetical protein